MNKNDIIFSAEDAVRFAGEFKTASADMNELIARMSRIKNGIESSMSGQLVSSFCEKYQELEPGFRDMEELITTISERLNQSASGMLQAQEELSKLWR